MKVLSAACVVFVLVTLTAITPVCQADWQSVSNCSPHRMYGVWVDSEVNAWSVGSYGTILHWNGYCWKPVERRTNRFLRAVWGINSDDVYAVGEEDILHWDGTTWSKETVNEHELKGVWGTSSDHVVVAGGNTIYTGSFGNWSEYQVTDANNFTDVWGSSENDIYVMADNGKYVHFDGSTWTTHDVGWLLDYGHI